MKKLFVIILLILPSVCLAEITYPMINSNFCIESKDIAKITGYPEDHVFNNVELWNRICRGVKSQEIIDSYLITEFADSVCKKYVSDQWLVISNNQPVDSITIHKNYIELISNNTKYKVFNGTETQELHFVFWYKNADKVNRGTITFCSILFILIVSSLILIIIKFKKKDNR